MAQRLGAFGVFRIADQAFGPFVHLAHGVALRAQRVGVAVQWLKLMIISGLEFKMLPGVILRRLQRLRENLQRQRLGRIRQTYEIRLLLAVLLKADRYRRPGVHRLQTGVHVVDILHVLRGPQTLRHRKRARPQLDIQHRRDHVFRPQRRFAAHQIRLLIGIWDHRLRAFWYVIQTRAGNRIVRVTHQEIARKLIVRDVHHRARFAHPGINGEGHLIVITPLNIIHRTPGFAVEINKSAPARNRFHQRKAALYRLAFQARHGERPALRAVVIANDIHAV
ncbi:hypothetical protein D3C78_968700 [compost metagenome]